MPTRKIANPHAVDQERNQPSRARRAVLTGGAAGLAAVAGATLGRAQPASAGTATVIEITPTNDNTGVGDTQAIVTAIRSLTNGGVVYLGPGKFYIKFVTGYSDSTNNAIINVPAQTSSGNSGGRGVSIQGSGSATVVNLVGMGSNIGFYCHRTDGYGAQYGLPAQQTTVFLRDFVVDGTNGGANAVGVDIGDGWGYDLDLTIVNFEASGCIGLRMVNRVFWTEKGRFRAQLMNNAQAAVIDTLNVLALRSHEYCDFEFYIFANANQNGIKLDNGAYCAGCSFRVRGNFGSTSSTNSAIVLNLTGQDGSGNFSNIQRSLIDLVVEANQNNANGPQTVHFGSSPGNYLRQCTGNMIFQFSPFTPSNAAAGQFSMIGNVYGDTTLTSYSVNNFPWTSANVPAAPVTASPANPQTTTSTIAVMAGLQQVITPASSGKVLAIIAGTARTNTASVHVTVGARYGSSTVPNNGDKLTGTRWGSLADWPLQNTGLTGGAAFTFAQVITGLTAGTQYWFDLTYFTASGSDPAVLTNLGVTLLELP